MTNTPGPQKKMHPVTEASIELGNLAYASRQQGYSLRLLAALLDTQNYGVVYQSMISAQKGRGGTRGPTLHSEKALLESNAKHLLGPMKTRGITPRRWCTAYSVELYGLFAPETYEMNEDVPILRMLQEDFPEAYGLSPPPYIHAYKEMEGFQHVFIRKKGIHIYKSATGIVTVSRNNGKALGLACKIQGLKFQSERLKVLLKDGPAAALAWLPTRPVKGIPVLNEQELKISEALKRESEINELIEKLALIHPRFATKEQISTEDKLYSMLNHYGMTDEQITHAAKIVRFKAGIY